MYGIRIKNITVGEQLASIKVKYPHFDARFHNGGLRAVGVLRPTARSVDYKVSISYKFKMPPVIKVVSPVLCRNFNNDPIPHIYPGKNLCLFMPEFNEFKYSDQISDTIIPWTSLWLFYYEVWHVTGEWLGGGIEHT